MICFLGVGIAIRVAGGSSLPKALDDIGLLDWRATLVYLGFAILVGVGFAFVRLHVVRKRDANRKNGASSEP